MLRFLWLFLLVSSFISLSATEFTPIGFASGDAVVSDDKPYYKYSDKHNNVEIIYTKDNQAFAKHTASVESQIHKDYKKFYGWELDETLYVGLISSHNQVANGFSTQWPNNRQINYIGGTQLIDMFCSTSWLDTLLYHETAHNYQINVKGSAVSRGLHSVFGNGYFLLPLPVIIPNVTENSFMLEGNAVLNESWHGNGGRLYSGLYKAQTILQAETGNIVAGDVYNTKYAFPYGDIVYIQGGFFNLYLAEKYGLKNVNNYFKYHSKDWWFPQFTNASMTLAVGKDFETSLKDFSDEYKSLAKKFVKVSGKKIVSSQGYYSLNSDKKDIFFIINESGVRAPELVTMNKKSLKIEKDRDSWLSGKVLKVGFEYLTQGSKQTSTTKIYQGLFDRNGFIKNSTKSKMVQGYLSDGRSVYFDVNSSFSQAQLYVANKFYTRVNSSVLVDKKDNLYYFRQEGKKRILYKNRIPLYSYDGFYGIVSDVDSKGNIYFIANSELGSSLYKYANAVVTRVSLADNIAGAKLINDSEVLLAAISSKDYYYVKNRLISIDKKPFETKLFFEDKEFYGNFQSMEKVNKDTIDVDRSNSYNSLLDMHYSGTDFGVYYGINGVAGTINVNFADPLTQNTLNAFISRDEQNITITGLGYSNSLNQLEYRLSAYSVVDDNQYKDIRDAGLILSATLPLYKAGYYNATIKSTFYQDYSTLEREPLTLSLKLSKSEIFAYSMDVNYLNAVDISIAQERDDTIISLAYSLKHDLAYEFYIGFGAKYSQVFKNIEELNAQKKARGVKVTNSSYQIDMDSTTISIPNIENSFYLESASYAEATLNKVINLSSYWFTFPLSIQRESLYTKYRYYDLKRLNKLAKNITMNEYTLGITFATVVFNSLELPINIEYIYNDDSSGLVKNSSSVVYSIGIVY